jgi:hypothetical protein
LWHIPLQVKVTVRDILEYGFELNPAQIEGKIVQSVLDSKDDRDVFPVKAHPGAETKVNVFFRDVWIDCKKYEREVAAYLSKNCSCMVGLFNDQASAWIIWFTAVWHVDKDVACSILSMCQDMDSLKKLSDYVKALGANRTQLGCLCTEFKTMACRGTAMFDPYEEVRCRINEKDFKEEKSCLIGEEIRPYVRAVLDEEIGKHPVWPSKEEYWSRRWLYTKSGAHSRRIEKLKLDERLDLPERPTRREFAESVEECMVAKGEPSCHAGQSVKLDTGSTRAIYSGDTINYYTFDYLLMPIETVWRNKSCLLDPGCRQPTELYSALANNMDVNLMIDFEDYNSQHEKSAMKVVIEEACAGAPPEVLKWALESFDKEIVYWREDGVEKSAKTVGSLFSGHRATTFLNTILNSAYIRFVYGSVRLPVRSYHAGDDVYLSGKAEFVGELVEKLLKSNVRINRSKQGCGRHVGEFLRVAFTRDAGRGYLTRCISSLVSGSWTTESRGSTAELALNYGRQLWTMMVRSGSRKLGWLLRTSMVRRLPEIAHYVPDICDLRMSVGGLPVLDGQLGECSVIMFEPPKKKKEKHKNKASFATDAFLDKHIDRRLLEEAGITREAMRRLMLEVSYKPEQSTLLEESPPCSYYVCPVPQRSFYGMSVARANKVREVTRGESAMAKLLGRLNPGVDWESLVRGLIGDKSTLAAKLDKRNYPITNSGTIGVSELAGLRSRYMRPMRVGTLFPVLV